MQNHLKVTVIPLKLEKLVKNPFCMQNDKYKTLKETKLNSLSAIKPKLFDRLAQLNKLKSHVLSLVIKIKGHFQAVSARQNLNAFFYCTDFHAYKCICY